MKKVMLLAGAGQIGMAIAHRMGAGMKIIVVSPPSPGLILCSPAGTHKKGSGVFFRDRKDRSREHGYFKPRR